MKQTKNKRTLHLRVPVRQEEAEQIKRQAESTGLTIAAYLRNVGMGYQIRGLIDNKKVEELARINGDLGRLGGLLKLWLTDAPRTVCFGAETIRTVLEKIEESQAKMQEVMRAVVIPKTRA